jgi:hypothetical protein
MIVVVRCVMGTWVFVIMVALQERLLSNARQCRYI